MPRLNRWLRAKRLQRWRTVEASLAALQPHRLTVKKTESPTGEQQRRRQRILPWVAPATHNATQRLEAEGFAPFFAHAKHKPDSRGKQRLEAEGLQSADDSFAQLIAPSTTQGELPVGGLEVAVVQLPSDCTTDSRFAVLGAISGQANAATGKGNLRKASREQGESLRRSARRKRRRRRHGVIWEVGFAWGNRVSSRESHLQNLFSASP